MKDAVAKIQANPIKILLVIEHVSGKLIGTVTDGDIRRAVLAERIFTTPIRQIMNPNPTVVGPDMDRALVVQMMHDRVLRHIPRVDAQGQILGLELLDEIPGGQKLTNEVIIMAGGRGERLKPLTDTTPKPMLSVGGKPILEKIIDNLTDQGFCNYTISVNYLADMITEYFKDGSHKNIRIRYLRENKRMGTAGALSLLPVKPAQPMLVVNGDILTRVNFESLVQFHIEHGAAATVCVREYRTRIPFGVVETSDHYIKRLSEKPEQRCLINAGIYVLSPEVLNHIPPDEYFDMPDLLNAMLEKQMTLAAFHVDEEWADIGLPDELHQAQIRHAVP